MSPLKEKIIKCLDDKDERYLRYICINIPLYLSEYSVVTLAGMTSEDSIQGPLKNRTMQMVEQKPDVKDRMCSCRSDTKKRKWELVTVKNEGVCCDVCNPGTDQNKSQNYAADREE